MENAQWQCDAFDQCPGDVAVEIKLNLCGVEMRTISTRHKSNCIYRFHLPDWRILFVLRMCKWRTLRCWRSTRRWQPDEPVWCDRVRANGRDDAIHQRWTTIVKQPAIQRPNWWRRPIDSVRWPKSSMHRQWCWTPSKRRRRMPKCEEECHSNCSGLHNGISNFEPYIEEMLIGIRFSLWIELKEWQNYLQNPIKMARIERPMITQCEPSAK